MSLLKLFSRKWLIATLLVIAGTLVLARLGIWQLDRLEQRRAFNAQVISARSQSVLDLNQEQPEDISKMEWRPVQVTGKYDFENQVAIRNQYYGNQYGYHLLTPLLSQGTAVLVDRGWIPADGNSTPEAWRKYDEAGEVKVIGQIRLGSGKPAIGGVADALPADGSKLALWNNADVAQVAGQLAYPILPVYIQTNADPSDTEPPIPFQPAIELTEGPHMGYALQWFTFAAILFFGYPFFVRKQEIQTK
ncbi:MAG: SURF1 family protein [Chloroflexota bacterium]